MESCPKTLIQLVTYSKAIKREWDDFVFNKSINSTFIHSRSFFDHNSLNDNDDSSLVFYKDKKIVSIFPAVLYSNNGKRILHSHLRATYGGFVVCEKVGIQESMEIVEQTISFAKEQKVDQIIVRNPYRIFHSKLCDETDYAMWFYGFKLKSRELEIVIPIHKDYCNNRKRYHYDCQQNIKKASKAVQVHISDDFESYWILLEKSLLERHGKRPVHDYMSICNLREKVGSDKVLLFNAFYNEKLIGGIVVFIFDRMVMQTQYTASDFDYKHLCPVHAIIDYLIVWGGERGFKYLNLGMANEQEGRKINLGLFGFKEGFGGRGMLRETMYLDL
jgi:hypothetical protein